MPSPLTLSSLNFAGGSPDLSNFVDSVTENFISLDTETVTSAEEEKRVSKKKKKGEKKKE